MGDPLADVGGMIAYWNELAKLCRTPAQALNLSPDQHSEQTFRQILSGVGSVVKALAAIRNADSDAHGRSKKRVRPKSATRAWP